VDARSKVYYLWLGLLAALVAVGVAGYTTQFREGLIATGLRDPVSWGFYIGNFTFLVGVAAAAVILVIPAYVYHWKPIKELVILGELLAIASLAMCMLFVLADMGRPDRLLHIMPIVGDINVPSSLLAWDVVVLNGYFFLNLGVATYALVSTFRGREPDKRIFIRCPPLDPGPRSASTPSRAFVYSGLPNRPFWNASLLRPGSSSRPSAAGRRSCSSSSRSCAARRSSTSSRGDLEDRGADGLRDVREPLLHGVGDVQGDVLGHGGAAAHALTLLRARGEERARPVGVAEPDREHRGVRPVPHPGDPEDIWTLNAGCVLILVGVFIEKGSRSWSRLHAVEPRRDLRVRPTTVEVMVTAGIFGVGALLFTLMSRSAIAVIKGELRLGGPAPVPEAAPPAA